jgi:tetratricopeptide (TPR) repeat protein
MLLFALAGAGAIVLLASIGTPGRREPTIDRHTGERIRVVRNVAEAIAEARATGNVRTALGRIRKRLRQFPGEPVLERTAAVLAAELADTQTPPSPAHPEAAVLRAEQERARGLKEELGDRAGERLNREALLALLGDLEADSAVAAAAEEFFAPLARWRPEHPEGSHRADELAARTLARLEEPAAAPGPELFLEVIGAYRSENRPRARVRWLLRAHAALPASREVRRLLVDAYLEHGRVREAFLLVGTALSDAPDDPELWEMRARMAGWLSLPEQEIEAREALLATTDTAEVRERLIALYQFAGRPAGAIPHARALAKASTDPEVLERPAQLALAGGDVDTALRLLEELALSADDPVYWREKIVTYAWQDQRVARVVRELDWLRLHCPDREEYEQRLEAVFRRRNMSAKLAALLDARLERNPNDVALENEVLRLHMSLGDMARVRAILGRRIGRTDDPRRFFANLEIYRTAEVENLAAHASRQAASDSLHASDVAFILETLRPWLEDPAFRAVAEQVARRFPGEAVAEKFLVARVDEEPTDAERARAAARLARDFPDHPAYLRAWIVRTSWAGDLEAETTARELWMQREPDDDANLRRLADLYGAADRRDAAVGVWRRLAEHAGLVSEATLHLIDALFAAGSYDEAIALLEKRANLPNATLAERLKVAEQLFGTQRFDRALRFYMAVLDAEEDHPVALMRAGQIRSWTNDPRGAIPFFARRLRATDDQRAEVHYYLGEAYWSIHDDKKGRRYHTLALEELRARDDRGLQQEVMVAKILSRFGRTDEARPIFEHVVAQRPDDTDLVLDYADSMAAARDLAKARELVDRAKGLAPRRARTMQADGKVLLLERRYEKAAEVLVEATRLHGPDAGTQSELGRAYELAGEWRPASEAYRRSLTLQADNRDVTRALQRLADRLAPLVHGSLAYRSAGDDRVLELWAQGSLPLRDERWRLGAAVGLSWFRGRAAAVNNGLTDIEEIVGRAQLSAFWRFRHAHTLAGGVELYPGAPGDVPVGGWIGLRLQGQDPYRSLAAHAHGHLLLELPAAAVGLGGRTTGIELALHHDVAERFWAAASLSYASLSLDMPSADDGLFTGSATFGWRVLDGETRVAEPLHLDKPALAGLVGTYLEAKPTATRGPLLSLWLNYDAFRLLGDQELASLIPIGERFDYLQLAGRADLHLAPGLGVMAEGYAGYDLDAADPIFGVQAGVTWRPSHGWEITGVAGYGTALGRADDADSFLVRLGLAYRW